MQNKGAAVQVNSNVTITALNKNNEVIQTIYKHNKATVLMVEGLLHFLQGWYSDTEFNQNKGGGTPEDSLIYIPTKLRFGNIGVNTKVEPNYGNNPMFESVNSGDFIEPTFNSIRLQSDLKKWNNSELLVDYNVFSDSEITSYEDLNNSESLRLISKIEPGRLVGETVYIDNTFVFEPYERSFIDPNTGLWTTMITEIGLFSSKDTLLARVLLDSPVKRQIVNDGSDIIGYTYVFEDPDSNSNPIIQDEETTLVVEWRIGLISVSDKDKFVTKSNIKYQDLASQLSVKINNQISQGSVITQENIEDMIIEILDPYEDIEVSEEN